MLFLALTITYLVARHIFFTTVAFGDYPLVKLSSTTILGEYVFSIWHRAAYGEPYPSPQGYALLYLFNQVASYFNDIRLFNILMNLGFPLSFLTFYLFSKRFCEGMWIRLFGATLYIINPVVITYYNFGGFMWCLVFLPFAFSFFIDLLEEHTTKNLAKAALFISLTMWTFPALSIALLVVLFIIAICYLMLSPSKLKFLKSIASKLLLLGLFVIICNAPYLFGQYIYLSSPSYSFEQFSILRDFKFTYRELTLSNFLRFAGNTGSPQVPLGYNDPININNETGLIVPIVAFASIFFIKNSQQKRTRIFAFLIAAFSLAAFAVILRSITYSDLSWILRSMFLLWTLRNPLKLQLMFAMCVIPLFIFSIEKITILCVFFFKKRDLKFSALTFAAVFLAFSHVYIYNSFVFSGYMGLDKTYGNLQNLLPNKALINIVEDSLNWYTEQKYRGVILPFDHNTELHVQFVNPLLYPSRLGLNSKVMSILDNHLKARSNLTNMLRLLSTRYVYINNEWRDTGFHILQPENLTEIVENLKRYVANENQSEHFKFVIEPTLPRLYLSNYPIFYSNIETIELINSSIFYFKPVFFEMRYNGCEIDAISTPNSMIYYSYYWEMPLQGVFDVYIVTYNDDQETTIYYSLDGIKSGSITGLASQGSLKYLAQFELKEGVHKLLLTTNDTDSFTNSDIEFYGDGSYNIEGGSIKIEDGVLLTLEEYNDFDLNLDFNPLKFGEKSWNGPNIYFGWTNSSYLRLIFHKDGYLEIAELSAEGVYREGVIVKQTVVTPGSWYNLRLIKANQTLIIYLNGEHLLTFTNSLLNRKGRIGIGSENSITYFKNVYISKKIIKGVWLFPAESPKDVPLTFIEMNPEKYLLQFNQTYNSFVILFLGENYDPFWEATIDGTVLKTHLKGNAYGNAWIINETDGSNAIIEIYYKPNIVYRHLLYLAFATIGILLITSYFQKSVLNKLLFSKKQKLVAEKK